MKLSDFMNNLEASKNKTDLNSSNLELILDILKKINSSLVLNEVLELVLINAINITKSERGFIVLHEDDKLNFKICMDNHGKHLSQESFHLSTSVVNDVYDSGQSKFIESALNDSSKPSQSIIDLKLQTIMCAPLKSKEEYFGVIYVDSQVLNKINNKEIIEMFEILAGQAGIVINNALMHQRQVSANNKLNKAFQELEIARQESNKFEELKNHFLSQMSHEIRTPINIIIGCTELLKSNRHGIDSNEIKELFTMLEQGSNRIVRTLEEIIEMSKIKSGNYEIHKDKIDLEKGVINPILKQYDPIAQSKGLILTFEISSTKNEIICDKFMIYQIIQELVDNAIKFTLSGSIKLRQFDNEDGKLCITITDTGIGISQEFMSNLFEPFVQEYTGLSRKFDGNGLALALVKKYCEMNNLSINIISQKEKGTEVTLVFN